MHRLPCCVAQLNDPRRLCRRVIRFGCSVVGGGSCCCCHLVVVAVREGKKTLRDDQTKRDGTTQRCSLLNARCTLEWSQKLLFLAPLSLKRNEKKGHQKNHALHTTQRKLVSYLSS